MRTKKVKPPPKKYDYTLKVSKNYDSIGKKDYISIGIITTKEFLTFRYLLKVESNIKDNKLYFNIIGFTAPKGDLSNAGVAQYEYKFYDFRYSEYLVVVERRNTDKIKFSFKVSKSRTTPITLSNIPKISFIEITS